MGNEYYIDSISHHGIRRYQNPDGSLTAAGKTRIKQIYSKDSQMGMDKRWEDQERI